jgi:outer membrane protein OmpA-like peptidoglycan-associated protein
VLGQQKKLSNLQVGYQRAIWEGLARAAGAKRVTFFVGTGTTAGAGAIPAVAVPNPNDKINAQKKNGNTSSCTLPSPALFVSDQATLIDKSATLKALKDCVGVITSTTKITVEGHTAGVPGANNAFAKDLSTRRATEVAALLRELKVPARNITKVVGYGSSQPLVNPGSDPTNRAVVVTFTTSG